MPAATPRPNSPGISPRPGPRSWTSTATICTRKGMRSEAVGLAFSSVYHGRGAGRRVGDSEAADHALLGKFRHARRLQLFLARQDAHAQGLAVDIEVLDLGEHLPFLFLDVMEDVF